MWIPWWGSKRAGAHDSNILGQFHCSQCMHENVTLTSTSLKSLQNTSLKTAWFTVMIFAFEMQTVSFFNLPWHIDLPALWVKSHFSLVNKYRSIYYISYSSNEQNIALCLWCSRVSFTVVLLLLHVHKHESPTWRIYTWSLNSEWNIIISKKMRHGTSSNVESLNAEFIAYLEITWIVNQTKLYLNHW